MSGLILLFACLAMDRHRTVSFGGIQLTDVATDDATLLARLLKSMHVGLPHRHSIYIIRGEGARIAPPPVPLSDLSRWLSDRRRLHSVARRHTGLWAHR